MSMILGAIANAIEGWFAKIIDFITGFFAFIPQLLYFIYASCASLLDFFQSLIRKLAGLDVYYVDGVLQSGDFLTTFLRGVTGLDKNAGAQYSPLSTVFWSMIIFGCALLIITTIIQIIKTHYNYDANKSHPATVITGTIKSFFTMAIVPIVAIFGFYLSNIVLKTLDDITSYAGVSQMSAVYSSDAMSQFKSGKISNAGEGDDVKTSYSSYDFFSFGSYTNNPTFSGVMFKVATSNCGRVRTGTYTWNNSSGWDDFGIFRTGAEDQVQVVDRIDYAFANNLTLVTKHTVQLQGEEDWVLTSSFASGVGAIAFLELINVGSFSKFNTGLVWYYYNLWGFNFFLGFAGIIVFMTLLWKIVFGLITRMIELMALFLIYPPLIGIMPIDGGGSYDRWKKKFIPDVLMIFGAVVGMNIFFLLLPFINSLTFFDPNAWILNEILNIMIMLAGLVMVEKFIGLVSELVGGSNAPQVGGETMEGVKGTALAAGNATMKLGGVGVKAMGIMPGLGLIGGRALGGRISSLASRMTRSSRDARFAQRRLNENAPGMYRLDNSGNLARNEGETDESYEARKGAMNETLGSDEKYRGRINRRERRARINNAIGRGVGTLAQGAGLALGINQAWENVFQRRAETPSASPSGGAAPVAAPSSGGEGASASPTTETRGEDTAGFVKLKAFGQGLLDLGGSALKLVGDLTGLSSAFDDMKKAGVVDEAKETIKSFYQAIGKDVRGVKSLQTTKDKEESEKNAAADQARAQRTAAENISATAERMEEITRLLRDLR